MKALLTALFFLFYVNCIAQWPSLNLYSAAGQVQIRANINYAVNRAADSLGKVLRKEFADSMAKILPIDEKTIVSVNGKATAVGGGNTNLQPVYDSIGTVAKNSAAADLILSNSINNTNVKVTTLETNFGQRISKLELWQTETIAQLTIINSAIATIPKKAFSVSTTTTTTTLQ